MTTVQPRSQTPVWPLILFVCAAVAFGLLRAGPALSGELTGSDDLMRMQQVRDLIAGQDWYDVSQKRLLTPEGGAMHWSRVPDLFLAAVVFLLQPLTGRAMAEGIAATSWPLVQLAWVLGALAVCLRRLQAPLSGQLAGLLFFSLSAALINFMPGRIDHHGLGVALTVTAFACLISPGRTARSAAVAGVSVAAMLTVAIENLPAVALVIAGFGSAWILRGGEEASRLRVFGASLIVAALITYVFDAPGAGGNRAVCDAYGQSHFVAMLVAGAGLFAIATVLPDTRDWRMRIGAMMIAGGVTAVSFIAVNPGCLGNPYAALSGEVQAGWLNIVSEARALPSVFRDDAALAFYFYGFGFAGLIAAGFGLLLAEKGQVFARACLLAFCATAVLISAWQLRGITLGHTFAAISAGWLFGHLFSAWRKMRGAKAALALFAGTLLLTPIGWTLPRLLSPEASDDADSPQTACKSTVSFRQIATAPRMIVFTPIDLGAPLIYHTRHYATAAPYHRNSAAIEIALSVFTGPTVEARRKIAATGATHLLYCPGLNELETYALRAPDGFAADLEAGRLPNWLVPLISEEETGGPAVYTIAFDRN